MSTPSGKLPHFVETAQIERQARPPEPDQPVKSGNDNPPRSPYAPKPADERAAARLRVLAKDDADDVLSAYAPKRARSPGSGVVTNSDADSLASVPKTLKEARSAALPQDTSAQAWADDAPHLSSQQPSGRTVADQE